jgi:hypothetical protein
MVLWRRHHAHHRHTRVGLSIDAKPYPFTQFGSQLSNDDTSPRHDAGPGEYDGH